MIDKEILTSIYDDLKNSNKEYFRTGFNDLDSTLRLSNNGEFVLLIHYIKLSQHSFFV